MVVLLVALLATSLSPAAYATCPPDGPCPIYLCNWFDWISTAPCEPLPHAGITQLVECNLAKVDVAGSGLVAAPNESEPGRASRGPKCCVPDMGDHLEVEVLYGP